MVEFTTDETRKDITHVLEEGQNTDYVLSKRSWTQEDDDDTFITFKAPEVREDGVTEPDEEHLLPIDEQVKEHFARIGVDDAVVLIRD